HERLETLRLGQLAGHAHEECVRGRRVRRVAVQQREPVDGAEIHCAALPPEGSDAFLGPEWYLEERAALRVRGEPAVRCGDGVAPRHTLQGHRPLEGPVLKDDRGNEREPHERRGPRWTPTPDPVDAD